MRTLTRNVLGAVLALFATLTITQAEELEIGAEMPMQDYQMTNVDDSQVSLADIKGEKGTVVVFWCNHCPWVVKWRDRLNEITKDYSDNGFGIVAVNSNDPGKVKGDSLADMKEYAEKYGYEYAYVVDEGSKLATAFGATRTPHVYVFNADDQLVYVGAIDDNAHDASKVEAQYLRTTLDALSDGQKVTTSNTKALGCTIKFYKN